MTMADDNPTDEPPNGETSGETSGKLRLTRRKFLWIAAGTAAGALAVGRLGFYPSAEWSGQVLSEWEGHVLAAAAAALIPDTPGELPAPGPSAMEVAQNVDAYLVGMPKRMIFEIHGMFALLEHGTLLGGSVSRLTRLSAEDGLDFLLALRERGGKLGQAFKGVRDLCLLGWYQDRRTWKPIGYPGPLLERPAPPAVVTPQEAGAYAKFVAKPGATPRGVL